MVNSSLDKALRTGKIITNDAAASRKKSEQLNIYKKKTMSQMQHPNPILRNRQ